MDAAKKIREMRRNNPRLFLGVISGAVLCFAGIIFHIFTSQAANSANYSNNGAASGRFPANATSVLVMDITIPDAWNGSSSVADIEKKAGSAAYWQGDTLADFTALGNTSGVGYKEDGTAGFQGTEAVVIDLDGDKAYTTQKDTLIDADGFTTTGPGTDTTPVGTLLVPMTTNIAANAHSVCTDSTSTPTAVRIDGGGGCTNSGGVGSAGTYLIGSGVSLIEADTTWGFNDKNGDGVFDAGESLYKINLAPRLVSTSTLVDADGALTTGPGTTTSTIGTVLTPFRHAAATGGRNVCVDNLANLTTMRINTTGGCNGDKGTYVLGTSATVAQIELTGRYSFVDDNGNGTFDAGEDIFKQSISGTYSGSGDTNVYNTAGLASGDPLTDFPADCDGSGAGTKKCRFTGAGTINSSSSILVDEGTQAGAPPNGIVDKQADQLKGIGVQNAGTAVNSTDILAVKVWVENGSSAGFQANQDILLGTMTVNSGNSREWRLGNLSQAIPAAGKRLYITADIAALPTNSSTLKFQIPVYNDAGGDNAASADNDKGIFVQSNNDGPNNSAVVNADTQVIDTQSPSVVLSTGGVSPTNETPMHFTALFDEVVSGFALNDISVSNGVTSELTAVSAYEYTFKVTPSDQGPVIVSIPAGAAADSAGNLSEAASPLSRTFDSISPSVVLSTIVASTTNISPIPVTATFSEVVAGFSVDAIAVSNGTAGNLRSISGSIYAFDITPSGQGKVGVNIASNVVQDAAGNSNTAASELAVTYDSSRPGVSLSSGADGSTTDISPISVTATFTESVNDFDASDIQVTNGAASDIVAVSSSTYTFSVSPAANGTVAVTILEGGAHDLAGNTNTASANSISLTFESPKPTVVLTSAVSGATNVSPIPVTVTFSKSVHGFTSGDVSVSGGSLTGGSFSAVSDAVYTFTITPSGQGKVSAYIPADTVTDDTDTYTNFESADLYWTYDSVAPTVDMTSDASSTTNISPVRFTATFSEEVSGFASGDISTTNGVVSSFLANSGSVYIFEITPSGQGTIAVNIAGNVAHDAAGNGNMSATEVTRYYHIDPPAFTIQYYSDSALTSSLGDNPRLKAGTYYLKITSDEALSDTPTISIDAQNSGNDVVNATTSLVAGREYKYVRTIVADTRATGSELEDISISGTDLAGNSATNASPTDEASKAAYTDALEPSVVISSTASSTTKNFPISVLVAFSEDVTGFSLGGVTVGNGSAQNLASTSASTYTFDIVPSGQGVVRVTIEAGAATDSAGNSNTASPELSRTFDSVRPTVSLAASATTTTSTAPVSVTATFSEDVTGFAQGDVVVGNGTVGNFSAVSASVYSFEVTPTDQGQVAVNIAGDVAQDEAGNGNVAADELDITYHSDIPLFTISYYSDSSLTNALADNPILKAGTYYIKITSSEQLSLGPTIYIDAQGTANDVVNATASLVSGNVYKYARVISEDALAVGSVLENISITGTGVYENTASDADPTNESTKAAYTDTVAPGVTLESSASSTTKNSPLPITVTFSEDVAGFAVGDIEVGNGAAGNFHSVGASVYTFDVSPTGQGTVTVNIPADVASDSAGNANTAAASALARTFDSVAPILTGGDPIGTTTSTTPSYTFSSDSNGSITYGGGCSSVSASITAGSLTVTFSALSYGKYNCTITVTDSAGNSTTLSIPEFTIEEVDVTPPEISQVKSTASVTTAVVEWNTDEPASSEANYGLTSISTLTSGELDTSPRVFAHTVALSDLVSCATYRYRVISRDASGNIASSSQRTFTTKGCAGNASVSAQEIVTVDKSSGGSSSLTSGGRGISLIIPAGFSDKNAEFQIKKLDKVASLSALGVPSGYMVAGDHVYDLHSLSDVENAITTFDKQLTVSLAYADEDIAGLDESTLVIFRNDGASWTALSNCVVNAVANVVTCDTPGFSTFSVFGKSVSPEPTPTPPPPPSSGPVVGVAPAVTPQISQVAQAPTTAAQTTQMGGTTTLPMAAPSQTISSNPYQFLRNLKWGMVGLDVQRLQMFLNSHGFELAQSGAGSAGNETTYFGSHTYASVKLFQESFFDSILAPQDLTRGTGLFYSFTRRVINSILVSEFSAGQQ